MVGQTTLVEVGLLLASLGGRAFALGLLLGDTGLLLGDLGAALAVGRFLAMRGDDLVTALVQPALAVVWSYLLLSEVINDPLFPIAKKGDRRVLEFFQLHPV